MKTKIVAILDRSGSMETNKMKAVRLIPEEHAEKTERLHVYACPFV